MIHSSILLKSFSLNTSVKLIYHLIICRKVSNLIDELMMDDN